MKPKRKNRALPRRAGFWLHLLLFLIGQVNVLFYFTLATDGLWYYSLVWFIGLILHFAYPRIKELATGQTDSNRLPRVRHLLADLHAGAYAAFTAMTVAATLRIFQQGWFSKNYAEDPLILGRIALMLGSWGLLYGLHRWLVHLLDERDELRERAETAEAIAHEQYPDTSRLLELAGDDSNLLDEEDIPLSDGQKR